MTHLPSTSYFVWLRWKSALYNSINLELQSHKSPTEQTNLNAQLIRRAFFVCNYLCTEMFVSVHDRVQCMYIIETDRMQSRSKALYHHMSLNITSNIKRSCFCEPQVIISIIIVRRHEYTNYKTECSTWSRYKVEHLIGFLNGYSIVAK